MYIVNASLDDAQAEAVQKRLMAPILANGGSIEKVDDWGIKEFAYEIDHMKKGHYVVLDVTADNEGIKEFQRLAGINANVVRYMVVKKESEK